MGSQTLAARMLYLGWQMLYGMCGRIAPTSVHGQHKSQVGVTNATRLSTPSGSADNSFGVPSHLFAHLLGCCVHKGAVMSCTDNGPDQKGSHNDIRSDVAVFLTKFYVRHWCLFHQAHIVVKDHLAQLSSHFSEVAIMCNVWRSTHMATRIFKAWASMFGHPRALRACRRLPGKPIAGRWGAVQLRVVSYQCGPRRD